jgi:hypothetical protein
MRDRTFQTLICVLLFAVVIEAIAWSMLEHT